MLLELTFIVLARPLEPLSSDAELTNEDIKALPMIGDVNLFLKNSREDPEFEVECEVMIAGRCSTLILLSPHLPNKQGKCALFSSPTSCRARVPRSTARTRSARPALVVRVRQARREEGIFRGPHRLGQRAEHRIVCESWL